MKRLTIAVVSCVALTHVILVARWEGTPDGGRDVLPVGVAYVTDLTVLEDTRLDLRKCEHVAVAMARQR